MIIFNITGVAFATPVYLPVPAVLASAESGRVNCRSLISIPEGPEMESMSGSSSQSLDRSQLTIRVGLN